MNYVNAYFEKGVLFAVIEHGATAVQTIQITQDDPDYEVLILQYGLTK